MRYPPDGNDENDEFGMLKLADDGSPVHGGKKGAGLKTRRYKGEKSKMPP